MLANTSGLFLALCRAFLAYSGVEGDIGIVGCSKDDETRWSVSTQHACGAAVVYGLPRGFHIR